MKNYIYIIFFGVLSFGFSQENINVGPSVVTGCGGSLQGYSIVSLKTDFTLGEIAIETVSSEEFILTQGFHQASLGIVSLNEEGFSKVSIYPNPTIDILNVELIKVKGESVKIQILDLSGKIIHSEIVSTNYKKHQIKTRSLSLGSYILEIKGEGCKDVFKIQKLK